MHPKVYWGIPFAQLFTSACAALIFNPSLATACETSNAITPADCFCHSPGALTYEFAWQPVSLNSIYNRKPLQCWSQSKLTRIKFQQHDPVVNNEQLGKVVPLAEINFRLPSWLQIPRWTRWGGESKSFPRWSGAHGRTNFLAKAKHAGVLMNEVKHNSHK